MWDAASVALLEKLWVSGHSAGQIASRLALQLVRRETGKE